MQDSLVEHRLKAVESDVGEIKHAIRSIDSSLQTLARLEERHAETRDGLSRAFEEIKENKEELNDVKEDVQKIKEQMPTLKLTSGLIMKAIVGILSIVGIAILAKVITQ